MSIRRVAAAVTAALAIVAASGSPTAALASAIPAGTPSVTELSNPSAPIDPADHPVTLVVNTVPALSGIRLSMDGSTVVTDASGRATITQNRNLDQHTLTLADTTVQTADQRYAFSRWVGQRDPEQAFTPSLGVTMRTNDTLTAAFDVARAVTPVFTDQHGQPIDAGLVSAATARSDTGEIVTIAPTDTSWLDSVRANYRPNAPIDMQNVSYSWQSVVVAGSNVVDAGRQSFTPATDPDLTVHGQFHDLTVTGYDALLGYGTGSDAVITFPDGTVQTRPLGINDAAVFPRLPRGTYKAQVTAGSSIVASQQIRLSRESTVSVPVISPYDLAIVLGSVALVALALVLIGRRKTRRRVFGHTRQPTMTEAELG